MTQDLAGSGLDERLLTAARAAGYEQLTPLQAAALPVLRRGGNVVLHASSGAGVTAAWGLPLLDRVLAAREDGEGAGAGPAGLVLAPTSGRAEAVGAALARLAEQGPVSVRATAAGWRVAGADVVVTTPDRALRELQGSQLKLERLQALVVIELADQFALGLGDALATLAGLVPRDAQRVVTSASLEGPAERFIEAQVRRALTVPARPADPSDVQVREPAGQIGYLVLAETEKAELLARLLEGVEGDAMVYVRTSDRAEQVRADIKRRGVGPDAIRVAGFGEEHAASERVISYDVPYSAELLQRLHATGGTVFVTPSELAHFRRIAAEVPFTLKQRRARVLEQDALDVFRDDVRAALRTADLDAQLLVLDPLFEEHSPAEVAAALSSLLRRRAEQPAPAGGAASAAPAAQSATAGPPPKDGGATFTRLFVSIGSRDNIRPGDLVGAITGEANIRGEQVGRVDIRDTFSVVEVAAGVAERVISSLNGTTMRGRSLRVDYDRKTGSEGGGGRGGVRRGPPRGGPPARRPPSR